MSSSSLAFDVDAATPLQLLGQRVRLQRELARAFLAQPLSHALIERIVNDLVDVENALESHRLQRIQHRTT